MLVVLEIYQNIFIQEGLNCLPDMFSIQFKNYGKLNSAHYDRPSQFCLFHVLLLRVIAI